MRKQYSAIWVYRTIFYDFIVRLTISNGKNRFGNRDVMNGCMLVRFGASILYYMEVGKISKNFHCVRIAIIVHIFIVHYLYFFYCIICFFNKRNYWSRVMTCDRKSCVLAPFIKILKHTNGLFYLVLIKNGQLDVYPVIHAYS